MLFLWVAGYGLSYLLFSRLAQVTSQWVLSLAMLAYICALTGWIFHTGQHRALGLCPPRRMPGKEYGVFALLLLLPVCNLLAAGAFAPRLPAAVLMLAVCAAEEIFFRGFLLRFLMQYGTRSAIIISSLAFALFHWVNLLGGSGFSYTLAQVFCAFAVGICYGAVTVRFGSLIPCFLAHFLTNVTAAPASAGTAPWLWLCIAACGGFGICLCKNVTK